MAEKTAVVDVAECDRHIWEEWVKLRDDPKADPDLSRIQIDIWLDARLQLMRERQA